MTRRQSARRVFGANGTLCRALAAPSSGGCKTVRSFHRGLLVVTAVAVMAAACNRADAPAPIDKDALAAVDDERLATYVQALSDRQFDPRQRRQRQRG